MLTVGEKSNSGRLLLPRARGFLSPLLPLPDSRPRLARQLGKAAARVLPASATLPRPCRRLLSHARADVSLMEHGASLFLSCSLRLQSIASSTATDIWPLYDCRGLRSTALRAARIKLLSRWRLSLDIAPARSSIFSTAASGCFASGLVHFASPGRATSNSFRNTRLHHSSDGR